MYDTCIFGDSKKLLEWAMNHTRDSKRAKHCVGWNGEMNYVPMSKDLTLLYQLANTDTGLEVVKLHMLLWSCRRSLRKDVFRVGKFFKPDGEVMWHSSIEFDGRADIPFLAVNAWMDGEFEKYSNGGCFEMSFSGIGCHLECMNGKGTIRFYDGNPVEMKRREENDPTIDHADVFTTELRMLNSWHEDDGMEPAGAEFAGIVEGCRKVNICGEKCFIISLWSGPMSDPASFPWTLLVSANQIEGRYTPRVGDMVHGSAYMFGTFFGDGEETPTVVHERFYPIDESAHADKSPNDDDLHAADSGDDCNAVHDGTENASLPKTTGEKRGWEWLPRPAEDYPECEHHGGGLLASVKKVHPKFVVYADYLRRMSKDLRPIKQPNRRELKSIIDTIDYVITKKDNLHVLASVIDVIGIRHMVEDEKSGERHLWCCLPSGVYKEHCRTNLLVALDKNNAVLRYTFHAGEWERNSMDRGMAVSINFQSEKKLVRYDSIAEASKHIGNMKESDYMIAASHGPTTLLQAWCDAVDSDGGQRLIIEWHVHGLPWQFRLENGTCEQFRAMLDEYSKHGIEAIQTMAKWKWCRMENGNV